MCYPLLELGPELNMKIPGTSWETFHWVKESVHPTWDTFLKGVCVWIHCTHPRSAYEILMTTSGVGPYLPLSRGFLVLPVFMTDYIFQQPLWFLHFHLSHPHRIMNACYTPGFYIGPGDLIQVLKLTLEAFLSIEPVPHTWDTLTLTSV